MPTSAIALKKPTSGFATITFRVDPAVKSRAEAIFKERGTTTSEALREYLDWEVEDEERMEKRPDEPDYAWWNSLTKAEQDAAVERERAAIRQGMKEAEAGLGRPWREVKAELDKKYGLA